MNMIEPLEPRTLYSVSLPPAESIGAAPFPGGAAKIQLDVVIPPENVGKFFEEEIIVTDLTAGQTYDEYVSRVDLPTYLNAGYGTANTYTFVYQGVHGHHYAFSAVQIVKSSLHGYLTSPASDVAYFVA